MSFQIKDFASISASILNYAKAVQNRLTDFSIGSVARTMLEAPAVEIEEAYQQMFIGLKEAIPVAIYNSFDFARLEAQPATGIIRVTITARALDTTISAGTIFQSSAYSQLSFVSLYDAVIAAGNTQADITVEAKTAGTVGNIAASTAFTSMPAIANMVSAVALASFTNGRDQETDAQRKARFAAYILSLNHGTVYALKYGLGLVHVLDADGNITESVRYSKIIEPWLSDPAQPPALVNVYIHNGVSGATADLIAEANKIMLGYTDANGNIISGWKAAGVKVAIYAATNVTVNIVCTVSVATGYGVAATKAAVQAAITDYIAGLGIGDDVLEARIIAAAMSVEGVTNFVLTTPAGDTAITDTQKAMMGTFTA